MIERKNEELRGLPVLEMDPRLERFNSTFRLDCVEVIQHPIPHDQFR